MTPDQIALVQSSFRKVVPIADTAAVLFYDRLFATADVRQLFPADMTEQRKKLMTMLATAVSGLSNFAEIAPAVAKLAIRHNGYGVRPEHYGPVGDALLWTLEQGLGDDFTPDVREAWVAVYNTLAGFMLGASAQGTGAAA